MPGTRVGHCHEVFDRVHSVLLPQKHSISAKLSKCTSPNASLHAMHAAVPIHKGSFMTGLGTCASKIDQAPLHALLPCGRGRHHLPAVHGQRENVPRAARLLCKL